MEIEPTLIEAEVYFYKPEKDSFYIKVTFVGTGMYINSFTVQPSKFENQKYWLQPPKHRQGKGWTATVDFDKRTYPLWGIIEQKAFEAVKFYKHELEHDKQEVKVVEADEDKFINLNDIPF